MATNLAIDDKLLDQALTVGGYKTKRETVNEALREFIQRRERLELVKFFGKVDYDPAYDYKRERPPPVILFDTSVLSRVFRRSRPGAEEWRLREVVEGLMASDEPLGLPGIVLREILSGLRSQKQFAELEQRLLTAFTIVLPSIADHIEAARLRNTCLTRGLSPSGPDCLIAAIAISGNHELYAADKDFQAIAKHAPLRLYGGR